MESSMEMALINGRMAVFMLGTGSRASWRGKAGINGSMAECISNYISYEGSWKENNMHGYGEYTWEDGRTYKGQYEDDKKQGFGVYEWVIMMAWGFSGGRLWE